MRGTIYRLRHLFILLLLLWAGSTQAQEKYTVSGYITEASTGENLIGVTVLVKELSTGATTNVYGFYSLSLPAGDYTLVYSYVGFEEVTREISLQGNQKISMELSEANTELEEVVITGDAPDANVTDIRGSVQELEIKTIEKMPALLGEVDLIRSIQLLPGVSTVGEGATGFNVRGGEVDQNLILLDEAPVFNSSHLFGFFSVFNPDAVKDVKLVKGGIPAQYGGRLSSILDVRMKEGNNKKFAANGGIGVIFSRLTLEAPIVKDKSSFIIAGRRSYLDVLAAPFLGEDLKGSAFNFYDLTLKTNYDFNEKNRLFLSGYFGRDNFDAQDVFKSNWGNATTTLRWNHLFNDRLFSNLTAYYSNYDYELGFGSSNEDRFDWNSQIRTYSLKPEMSYYINPDNLITFGGQSILYDFEPGNAVGISVGEATDISLPNKYALESALYLANEQTVSERLSLEYGLRWSHFNYMGKGTAYTFAEAEAPGQRREPTSSQDYEQWESIQTYNNWEPRFALRYKLNESSSIKASYNRMVQYLHLISNTVASTPLDVWTPSTNNIKPQLADQYTLGYFRNFAANTWEFSVEGYYKNYQNLVEYIDGSDILLNRFLEGDLLNADGRAYGLEFFLEKKTGDFTGWISYTLARSERLTAGINQGDWYPARFDRTHTLNVVTFYEVNPRWSLSANFVLNSGTPATFPTDRIEWQGYVFPYNANGARNNVRLPLYHRLDFSATLQGKKKEGKRKEDYWVFGVYNVYSRKNPYSIYFQPSDGRAAPGMPVQTEAVRLSIVGNFIPSISYNFKF